MDALVVQWLTTAVLWFHVSVAVMWIGASFYLVSWENKLNRTSALRSGVDGNFWTLQGGDFYFVEKLRRAPPELPASLNLFRYEAYLTWVSGLALLCLVFYFNAATTLSSPRLANVPPAIVVVAGLASLVCSWVVYELFCRTALADRLLLTAGLGLSALAVTGYFFGIIFSERAAFLHVGAVIGTIMCGNVFFVIIPWHKAVIRALETSQPLDDLYKSHPKIRSIHNHYLALPVLFIMLSGHFPLIVGHPNSWALLTGIALSGGLIKHHHNLVQQGRRQFGFLAGGLFCFLGVAMFSSKIENNEATCAEHVSFTNVQRVVTMRCVPCHSSVPYESPSLAGVGGVHFDTPEQIASLKERILDRAVLAQTMPPSTYTKMRPAERNVLGCWINSGGRID